MKPKKKRSSQFPGESIWVIRKKKAEIENIVQQILFRKMMQDCGFKWTTHRRPSRRDYSWLKGWTIPGTEPVEE